MSSAVETATEVRPFHVDVPEEVLDDLRRRIAATRWPEKETVADATQGVQLATIEALASYWGGRCLAGARPVHDRDPGGLPVAALICERSAHVRERQ